MRSQETLQSVTRADIVACGRPTKRHPCRRWDVVSPCMPSTQPCSGVFRTSSDTISALVLFCRDFPVLRGCLVHEVGSFHRGHRWSCSIGERHSGAHAGGFPALLTSGYRFAVPLGHLSLVARSRSAEIGGIADPGYNVHECKRRCSLDSALPHTCRYCICRCQIPAVGDGLQSSQQNRTHPRGAHRTHAVAEELCASATPGNAWLGGRRTRYRYGRLSRRKSQDFLDRTMRSPSAKKIKRVAFAGKTRYVQRCVYVHGRPRCFGSKSVPFSSGAGGGCLPHRFQRFSAGGDAPASRCHCQAGRFRSCVGFGAARATFSSYTHFFVFLFSSTMVMTVFSSQSPADDPDSLQSLAGDVSSAQSSTDDAVAAQASSEDAAHDNAAHDDATRSG